MELSRKEEIALFIIWTQALVATLGSLFYSEVVGYTPCDLCWIQRIFMYPLVIIYGVSLMKKDFQLAFSGLILSGVGMLISIYHYSLQKVPFMQDAGGFCTGVPCNLQYVNYFGFITIPFLAGLAFIIIFVTHLIVLRSQGR
ncbi:MAG TPA: disulfide oxidoreductase [Pseudogracilibacillus sp.]|nr:disulfide oxidoreductase [Pseudogracilibacillus sp.]